MDFEQYFLDEKQQKVEVEYLRKRDAADAKRYRWLRDNKHLDIWWSMQGPENRCDNIDEDIDEAMEDKND